MKILEKILRYERIQHQEYNFIVAHKPVQEYPYVAYQSLAKCSWWRIYIHTLITNSEIYFIPVIDQKIHSYLRN